MGLRGGVGRQARNGDAENPAALFGHASARAAHFLGHVLLLRHAVLDRQDRFLIVNVHAGLERQIRNDCGVYVGKSHPGMLGKNVPAAELAPLAIATCGLIIRADVFRTTGDTYGVRLPKREGIHRARGPASTRVAVAIAHGHGLSADCELDGPAKTRSAVVVSSSHMRLLVDVWIKYYLVTGRLAIRTLSCSPTLIANHLLAAVGERCASTTASSAHPRGCGTRG